MIFDWLLWSQSLLFSTLIGVLEHVICAPCWLRIFDELNCLIAYHIVIQSLGIVPVAQDLYMHGLLMWERFSCIKISNCGV